MKAVFKTKMLASAVSAVGPAVGRGSPKEAYKMIKATFGTPTTLAATDGEVSIVRQVPEAIIDSPGSALFPAEKLTAILRETTAEEITIECIDGIAHIKAGSSRFKIPLNVADEFPESPVWDATNYYSVASKDMEAIAAKCVFSDPKHKVPSIAGVAFDVDGESLTGMSTDSKCLIVVPAKIEKHGEGELFCVPVPMKSVKIIGSVLDDQRVAFAVTKNSILFRTQLSVVSSQLLAGRVIDFRRQFKEAPIHKIPIIPEMLARSIRQCQITTSEESKRVLFHFDGGTLRMKSSAASAGESAVEMPIQFEGDIKASLIPDGLLTGLKMFDDTSVEFCLTADDGPIRVIGDSGVRYVQAQCQKDE